MNKYFLTFLIIVVIAFIIIFSLLITNYIKTRISEGHIPSNGKVSVSIPFYNKFKLCAFGYDLKNEKYYSAIFQYKSSYFVVSNNTNWIKTYTGVSINFVPLKKIYPSFHGNVIDLIMYDTYLFVISDKKRIYNPFNYSFEYLQYYTELAKVTANPIAFDLNPLTDNISIFYSSNNFTSCNFKYDFTFYYALTVNNKNCSLIIDDKTYTIRNGNLNLSSLINSLVSVLPSNIKVNLEGNKLKFSSDKDFTIKKESTCLSILGFNEGDHSSNNKSLTSDYDINLKTELCKYVFLGCPSKNVCQPYCNGTERLSIDIIPDVANLPLISGISKDTIFYVNGIYTDFANKQSSEWSDLFNNSLDLPIIEPLQRNKNIKIIAANMELGNYYFLLVLFGDNNKEIFQIVEPDTSTFILTDLIPYIQEQPLAMTKLTDNSVDYIIITDEYIYNYYLDGYKQSWAEIEKQFYNQPLDKNKNILSSVTSYEDGLRQNWLVFFYTNGDWFELPLELKFIFTDDGKVYRSPLDADSLHYDRMIKHLASENESWKLWPNVKTALSKNKTIQCITSDSWTVFTTDGFAYSFDDPNTEINAISILAKTGFTIPSNFSPPNVNNFTLYPKKYNTGVSNVLKPDNKMSFEDCKNLCINDKSCVGFQYDNFQKKCGTFDHIYTEHTQSDDDSNLYVSNNYKTIYQNKFLIKNTRLNKYLYVNPEDGKLGMSDAYPSCITSTDIELSKKCAGIYWKNTGHPDISQGSCITSLNPGYYNRFLKENEDNLNTENDKCEPTSTWNIVNGNLMKNKQCYVWDDKSNKLISADCAKKEWEVDDFKQLCDYVDSKPQCLPSQNYDETVSSDCVGVLFKSVCTNP